MFAFSFNFFIVGLHLTDIFHLFLPSAFSWDLSVSSQPISMSLGHLFLSASSSCYPWFSLLFFPPSSCHVLPLSPLSGFVYGIPLCPSPSLPLPMILFSSSLILCKLLPSHPSLVLFMVPSILFFQVLSPVFALFFFCLLVNKVFNIISFL